MTIHTLFVIVLVMFIISLVGDIVLAHRLNNHTKDYDELLTRVNNINEWCNKLEDKCTSLENYSSNVILCLIKDKDKFDKELNTRFGELDTRLNELELDVVASDKAIKNVNSKIVSMEDQVKLLNTDADSLEESINYVQDQVNKLTEPEQATKEQILRVLDEQNVLTSSIKDGTVILEEK